MKLSSKPWVLPIFTGVAGAVVGFSIGFAVANRRRAPVKISVAEKYEQIKMEFEEKIDNIKKEQADKTVPAHPSKYRGFNVVTNNQVVPTNSDFAAYDFDDDGNAFEVPEEKEEVDPSKVPSLLKLEVEYAPGVTNIFTVNRNWDYTEECKHRSPHIPYVLHQDEFMSNESGLDQTSLDYYQADDVMCDDHDEPVENYLKTVGELKFGHGSSDANVFYVRNEPLMLEFEIMRSYGSYREEVLGERMEHDLSADDLKHSNRKFRPE